MWQNFVTQGKAVGVIYTQIQRITFIIVVAILQLLYQIMQ